MVSKHRILTGQLGTKKNKLRGGEKVKGKANWKENSRIHRLMPRKTLRSKMHGIKREDIEDAEEIDSDVKAIDARNEEVRN